jgi:hypothetical protein
MIGVASMERATMVPRGADRARHWSKRNDLLARLSSPLLCQSFNALSAGERHPGRAYRNYSRSPKPP